MGSELLRNALKLALKEFESAAMFIGLATLKDDRAPPKLLFKYSES